MWALRLRERQSLPVRKIRATTKNNPFNAGWLSGSGPLERRIDGWSDDWCNYSGRGAGLLLSDEEGFTTMVLG